MDYDAELYQRQVNFLEEFLEFHPDALEAIADHDRTALMAYFGLRSDPVDIFLYRRRLISQDRCLQRAATDALRTFLVSNGVQNSGRLLPRDSHD